MSRAPDNDSELLWSGHQGANNLRTLVDLEPGHLLGFENAHSSLVVQSVPAAMRRAPSSGFDAFDTAVLDQVFADGIDPAGNG